MNIKNTSGTRVIDKKGRGSGGFTHFLSLPLANIPEVKETYTKWRQEIHERKHEGLPDRLLINPNLLHVTLMMLNLSEAGQIERARDAVKKVEPKIKALITAHGRNGKLRIEFDKLDIFGTET